MKNTFKIEFIKNLKQSNVNPLKMEYGLTDLNLSTLNYKIILFNFDQFK